MFRMMARPHGLTKSPIFRFLAGLVLCVMLAGCAETQFLFHTAKRMNPIGQQSGTYKIGNPYQIQGTWYHPAEDLDYVETGIASWYGPNFHGKRTANGEIFDENALTAAHRTLPMPSIVRVTNLENGRSLVVTVNDRGPFAKGRIIDMSRRSSQLLGFQGKGTARVKVEILREESLAAKARAQGGRYLVKSGDSPLSVESLPKANVSAESLPPLPGAKVAVLAEEPAVPIPSPRVGEETANAAQATSKVDLVPVADTNLFIQAGAFGVYDNANKVRAALSPIGKAEIQHTLVNNHDFYRVRLGPLSDVAEADQLLQSVISGGFPDARIVVD